jgi:F-type H+-transporting ATPase subunit delta
MKQMVASKTNAVVEFQTEVDPSLVGGFVLEYDTYRLDMSVKRQLNDILKQLNK